MHKFLFLLVSFSLVLFTLPASHRKYYWGYSIVTEESIKDHFVPKPSFHARFIQERFLKYTSEWFRHFGNLLTNRFTLEWQSLIQLSRLLRHICIVNRNAHKYQLQKWFSLEKLVKFISPTLYRSRYSLLSESYLNPFRDIVSNHTNIYLAPFKVTNILHQNTHFENRDATGVDQNDC